MLCSGLCKASQCRLSRPDVLVQVGFPSARGASSAGLGSGSFFPVLVAMVASAF